jgi:hypothetical protein
MAKKKNIHKLNENAIQKKVDEIKLESHVLAVKNNHHVDIAKQVKYHASNLRSAIDETVLWAKKEKLGKQTLKLLDTLVDGFAVFLTSLIKDKE